MANLYFCRRCRKNVPAALDKNGKERVRGFPSGYVARFLDCPGHHTCSVNDKPVQPAQSESEAA